MYYFLLHTLPQLATHTVYTLGTWAGQAATQASRPGQEPPDPPDPPRAYIDWFVLVFMVSSSSSMLRGLLVVSSTGPESLHFSRSSLHGIGLHLQKWKYLGSAWWRYWSLYPMVRYWPCEGGWGWGAVYFVYLGLAEVSVGSLWITVGHLRAGRLCLRVTVRGYIKQGKLFPGPKAPEQFALHNITWLWCGSPSPWYSPFLPIMFRDPRPIRKRCSISADVTPWLEWCFWIWKLIYSPFALATFSVLAYYNRHFPALLCISITLTLAWWNYSN